MGDFFNTWMPHGHCFFWRPSIYALHVASDAVIAIAYFAIPVQLLAMHIRSARVIPEPVRLLFVRKNRIFVAFIIACGLTHIMDIVTIHRGWYGAEGLLKLACAAISAYAALALPGLIYRIESKAPEGHHARILAQSHERLIAALDDSHAETSDIREALDELAATVGEIRK